MPVSPPTFSSRIHHGWRANPQNGWRHFNTQNLNHGHISVKNHSKIPASSEEVSGISFFSKNLSKNYAPYMGFIITNGPIPEKMYPGMIISYKVSPVLNIPMSWVTEITRWTGCLFCRWTWWDPMPSGTISIKYRPSKVVCSWKTL